MPLLKYPVTNVIHRITPSAKAAQKQAGKLRATAGQLLQVTEPVPSSSSLVLQSRISAMHMFGKVINRPTSAGSFFYALELFVSPARLRFHPMRQ